MKVESFLGGWRIAGWPNPATGWLRTAVWAGLAIVTLAVCIAPDVLSLPKPRGAIVLDQAEYLPSNGSTGDVRMPDAIYARLTDAPESVRYRFRFDLPAVSQDALFVFVPSFNRRIVLSINGTAFFDSDAQTIWTGAFVSASSLTRLPSAVLFTGPNVLTMDVFDVGLFAVPVYLSELYVGTAAELSWPFKIRTFIQEHLKIMALAAHLLLGIGMIVAFFFRPKDPLFSWIVAFIVVNLVFAVGMLVGWQPSIRGFILFFAVLAPPMGLLFVGFSLALVGVQPPKILLRMAVAITCVLLPCVFVDSKLTRIVVALNGASSIVIALFAGAGVIAWSAFRWRDIDARLILPSAVVLAWYAGRDTFVTATLPAHGFNLLTPYARPVFLAFLTGVLLRRIGVTLDQLDRANDTLSIKLAEREAELARERAKTASLVREQERQRLTHDLHDGISGHLVSIIALSERTGDKSTEQAAREALNDLRLVINSLDLGDRELPLALANFRDRLVPQLQRLGVELDWSIAHLPEVSGVTPGNALAILRILQEAVTNAVKHGPARRIAIRGSAAADGAVAITVENDGRAFAEAGSGYGLGNMRRRAERLNGKVSIEALDRGTKFRLMLPSCLPVLEDEVVA